MSILAYATAVSAATSLQSANRVGTLATAVLLDALRDGSSEAEAEDGGPKGEDSGRKSQMVQKG